MTDTPIRTFSTIVGDSDARSRDLDAFLPADWEPGTPLLVIAGPPEGAWVIGAEDVVDPGAEVVGVIVRPKPVPDPPATERVHWSDAVGRKAHYVYETKSGTTAEIKGALFDDEQRRLHGFMVDRNRNRICDIDADGMVEVLVAPAPTGDDEPAEADNAPDLTPLFDALDSYDESPSADMPDVDRAVDALVDAVRALRGEGAR